MPSPVARAIARLGFTLTLAVLTIAALSPAPVGAFPLSSCTLSLTSTADGRTIDTAEAGALDSTQADPFQVAWDGGTVRYVGTTGSLVIRNYAYHVEVFGIPTPIRGGNTNDDGNTTGDGTVSVAANSPFRVTGLYFVTGGISGEGGGCDGSGWFQLLGDPVGTAPWLAAAGIGLVSLLGLLFGFRGHAVTGVVAGIVFGLSLGVLSVLHSFVPVGENTVVLSVGLGLVLGILAAIVGNMLAGSGAAAAAGGPGGAEPPGAPPDGPPPDAPPEA